jgi:hypothetical protein
LTPLLARRKLTQRGVLERRSFHASTTSARISDI